MNDAGTDKPAGRRLPPWLQVSLRGVRPRGEVRGVLRRFGLHSVCESANCPNLCECWRRRTATFMILGDRCTRNCRFCAVDHGQPLPVEADEAERLALAAVELGLRHVVVTSVTRDDLEDGGAGQFVAVVAALRHHLPSATIELLTPDFRGCLASLDRVLAARPEVFNHNLETCRRLTGSLRDGADYDRSLAVLRHAATHRFGSETTIIKSGLMLGVGETDEEIRSTLGDLRAAGVESITLGQYLAPSAEHLPVARFVSPADFEQWGEVARTEFGFAHVASGPQVRSSYLADLAVPGQPGYTAPG